MLDFLPMSKRTRSLVDETHVTCPYCHQTQLLVVDPETEGELVQDCDVCCRPWRVWVARDGDGELSVEVTRGE
jgi:uncharacterized protein YbaR (Trm112 family)